MPKNKPPKYCKIKNYAVIYLNGKAHYLGIYNSPESRAAYARFEAEWWQNAGLAVERRAKPKPVGPSAVDASTAGTTDYTVTELAATFLDHMEAMKAKSDPAGYGHYRIVILDFLTKFYGDIPVDCFKPSCLKLVRAEMIKTGRFCRKLINKYITMLVRISCGGVKRNWCNQIRQGR